MEIIWWGNWYEWKWMKCSTIIPLNKFTNRFSFTLSAFPFFFFLNFFGWEIDVITSDFVCASNSPHLDGSSKIISKIDFSLCHQIVIKKYTHTHAYIQFQKMKNRKNHRLNKRIIAVDGLIKKKNPLILIFFFRFRFCLIYWLWFNLKINVMNTIYTDAKFRLDKLSFYTMMMIFQ